MTPTDLLYLLVLGFIRTVKWVELQFLRIFSRWINKKVVEYGETCGLILHFTQESYEDWSTVNEEKALAKCTKYDKLLHVMIHDKSCLVDLVNNANWGMGEAYVNGKYAVCKGRDKDDLAQAAKRLMENGFAELYYNCWNKIWYNLEFELFNLQTRSRARQVTDKHYDLGSDIFEAMLDPWMQYTCAYWANADNLNDAQLAKMELIAQKLNLKPGMCVLDIGCGWGMLCKYLTERHGVTCVGVNIANDGIEFGRKACEGLSVEFLKQDYRDKIEGTFDRIVVVELIEHVGRKNYEEFFQIAAKHLTDDGIFLLQVIGINHDRVPRCERWLCTRIFPNTSFPRPEDIMKVTKGLFVIEDWHNFGLDFTKTINGWRQNFKQSWPALKDKYGDKFYRTWIYYLVFSEGLFASRRAQLWQIVFSKDGLKEAYRAAR